MLNIRIASTSDIHLGHKKTPTAEIIEHLNATVCSDKTLASVDLLILAGDIYDDLMDVSDPDGHLIDLWIARLIRKCIRHNVKLRVLEGTPSHDRKQSAKFKVQQEINEKTGYGKLDLEYVTDLSIEYIADFDANVLYIPDEWGTGTDAALERVLALMAERELTQVDIAIMHGMFGFQVEFDAKSIHKHDEEVYSQLVKYMIFIGHIHTYANYKNIYAHGSFDRLAHGEEGPKGYLIADILGDDYRVQFVENKHAKTYKTIFCDDVEVVDNLETIGVRVAKLPEHSHLRIEANKGNPILTNVGLIKERWPGFHWSFKHIDPKEKESSVLLDHKQVYVPIQLNRQNLREVIRNDLKLRNHPEEAIARCDALLVRAL